MPRGRKRAEVAAEPSRARERDQSALRETDKDSQHNAPKASASRRSARIRAIKAASHPREKDQLRLQQSYQQTPGLKNLTSSRHGATTITGSKEDTAPAKPLTKKGKSIVLDNRKSRQIPRSSKPKTVSKPQRKATANRNEQSRNQPSRKGVKRGKAKSSDPALGSSEIVLADESGRSDRREEFESLDDHQVLTQEALKQHTLNSGLVGAAHDEELTYADPREEFNYKYGYLPPLDEEASYIIAAILDNPALATKMGRIGAESPLFEEGLERRNVQTDPSKSIDPRSEEIKSFSLEGFLQETAEQEQVCEHLWLRDKAKLGPDSSEAIFQRTLMLSLIARHFLIYEKVVNGKQLLDYSAEEPWTCLPMPSRALWNAGPGLDTDEKLLTQPKPDLSICFNREAVIEHGLWTSLPGATQELACFENRNSGDSRIFHFLAVEAMNANTRVDNSKALCQSLNNASQALNNFYEFFQDAGPTHRQIFFDKIRFFSVVANNQGILIRSHRAIEIPQDASLSRLVLPSRPEYRLEFEYREFARLTGEDGFTREKVIEAFRKMLKYGRDELSGWISDAAKDLSKKVGNDLVGLQARSQAGFYRHGQPSPQDFEEHSRCQQSYIEKWKSLGLGPTDSQCEDASAAQSLAEVSTDRRITPKAKNSQQKSQRSNRSNRRRLRQVEIESTDSEDFQVTRKRSRKATGKPKS